ncbi:MAG TPA: hypothetical protein GX711_04290 [Clostridia bacterium]|nr:hypothetical protein [Clostridia bacterium]
MKPGRFTDIHPQMLANADDYRLPLIQIPYNVAFTDILYPIMRHILGKETQYLERYVDVQNTLTETILAGGSVNEIAEIISRNLHNVVTVHDENMQCLACYHGAGNSNDQERLSLILRQVSRQQREYSNLGDYPSFKFLTLPENEQEIRYIEQPIIGDGIILGYLRIWELEHQLTEADLAVAKQCATMLAVDRLKFLSSQTAEKKYRQRFLQELLNGHISSRGALKEAASSLDLDFSYPRAVTIFSTGTSKDQVAFLSKRTLQLTNSYTSTIDPTIIAGNMAEGLVVLWPHKDTGADLLEEYLEKLMSILEREYASLEIYCGVGRTKEDPLLIRESYSEAKQAVSINFHLYRRERITYYDRLGTYRALVHLPQCDEVQRFLAETIGKLLEYDQSYDTELIKTLESYFSNNGNLAQMAKELYVHYNTVRNRLQRIGEICQVDLDDPEDRFSLELGLKLYKLKRIKGPQSE